MTLSPDDPIRELMDDVLDGVADPAAAARFAAACRLRPEVAEEFALLREMRRTTLRIGLDPAPVDLRRRIAAAVDRAAAENAAETAAHDRFATQARRRSFWLTAPFTAAAAAVIAWAVLADPEAARAPRLAGRLAEAAPESTAGVAGVPTSGAPSPDPGFAGGVRGGLDDESAGPSPTVPYGAQDKAGATTGGGSEAPTQWQALDWAAVDPAAAAETLFVMRRLLETDAPVRDATTGRSPAAGAASGPPVEAPSTEVADARDEGREGARRLAINDLLSAERYFLRRAADAPPSAPPPSDAEDRLRRFGRELEKSADGVDVAPDEAAKKMAASGEADRKERTSDADLARSGGAPSGVPGTAPPKPGRPDGVPETKPGDVAGTPGGRHEGGVVGGGGGGGGGRGDGSPPPGAAPARSRGQPTARGGGGARGGAGERGFPAEPKGGGAAVGEDRVRKAGGGGPGRPLGAPETKAKAAPAEADGGPEVAPAAPTSTGVPVDRASRPQFRDAVAEARPELAKDVLALGFSTAEDRAAEAYFVSGAEAFAAVERALVGRGAVVRELPILTAGSISIADDRALRTRFLEIEAPSDAVDAVLASLRARPGVVVEAAGAASAVARRAASRPSVRRVRIVVTRG